MSPLSSSPRAAQGRLEEPSHKEEEQEELGAWLGCWRARLGDWRARLGGWRSGPVELLLQDSSRPLRSWEASDRESLEVLGEGKRKKKRKNKRKRKFWLC